jgi:ATP-dependent DNA helicase RecQ
MTATIQHTLKTVFGFHGFRFPQQEVIERVVAGEDVFLVMPTGGGKSLCYQIPALHRSGLTIVISPLIALMKDQVDALLANGVRAACFNSSLSSDEARRVSQQMYRGELDLLYVAPERLMQAEFLERLSCLLLTRLTASLSGGTISVPTTSRSAESALFSRQYRLWP